uniref:Uncharacterized protein n=1 Tax=Aegilops tauschii subsp. strangulata TaxID=200361 RepID=A0A453JU56_AEGTS
MLPSRFLLTPHCPTAPAPTPTPTHPGGARSPGSVALRFGSPGGVRLRRGRGSAAVAMASDGRVERIASSIRAIPNFPKPGERTSSMPLPAPPL